METNDLAKKLKDLRAKRGMSQEYLAEESQVSLRTIQRIENNESKPTGETIKRIALAMGVKLDELIDPGLTSQTTDLSATIVYLKKQLSKTNDHSDIKTLGAFIALLKKLQEKDLTPGQLQGIESYIQYLELEKIPSFSNEMYKQKLSKFKKYLKRKLGFVPQNQYTIWTASFATAFAIGFAVQNDVDTTLKFGVLSMALLAVGIGAIQDHRIKKQNRSLRF